MASSRSASLPRCRPSSGAIARCSSWKPSKSAIFEIRNIAEEQLQPILGIACPGISLYPYLRAVVADIITRAGFPPVHMSEVNFQAMFEGAAAGCCAKLSGKNCIITAELTRRARRPRR